MYDFNLDDFWLIIKIVSFPAFLKLYILIQSLRIYGVYNLWKNKEDIFNHKIYSKLDRLYTDQELFNKIEDIARREIFKDIFKLEIQGLNEVLLFFREHIYVDGNILKFMLHNKGLDSKALMSLFLRLFNAHRDKLEKKIRFKLARGGLDSKRIIYVTQKYYEFTDETTFLLRKKLEILEGRKNLYYSVMDILDRIEIEIEAQKFYLPNKFSKLNGKLDNIVYKGYESYNESGKYATVNSDKSEVIKNGF